MPARFSRALAVAVALAAPLAFPHASAGFTITGTLPDSFGTGPVEVQREFVEGDEPATVATAPLDAGKFRLTVDAGPGLFRLNLASATVVFVAAADDALTVSSVGDGAGLQVGGGADQERFLAYEAFRQASLARNVTAVRSAARRARDAGLDAEADRLSQEEVAAYERHRRELNDFTLASLRGSAALYAASLRWHGDYRLEELAELVDDYATTHPEAEIVRRMRQRIDRFRAVALGAPAPELAGRSPDGAEDTLSAWRGRVVLVDFWASWCTPCRIENRNYAALYDKYRAAGFEIFAVSLDENATAWRNAVTRDGARWRQISDLRGYRSPLAMRYNVTALPANFLLDRDGRILAKDVRGESLARLLAEQFPP